MTIGEALNQGTALLAAAGKETPALDASLLLADILHTGRTGLVLAGPDPLPEGAGVRFAEALERRRAGECVAYILGHREFRGLDFLVGPEVLVPRPDTETLVEAALAQIDALPLGKPLCLLDLGTGSGAAAVSLKHERPQLMVYASDISPAALSLARRNTARLLGAAADNGGPDNGLHKTAPDSGGLDNGPVRFIESDLFDRIPPVRFDLIVSNPPYVPAGIIPGLAPEVQREPRIALDGGEDGLDLIRRIIQEAPNHLQAGGVLLMEAGPGQMEAVSGILASRGFLEVQTYRDLSHRDRVIGGTYG
jgi:release factor glutamine methyltransferase